MCAANKWTSQTCVAAATAPHTHRPLLCRFEKREHHSTSKCFAVFLLMRALFIIDVRSRELYQSTAVWGEQVSVPCRLPCPTLTTRMSRFLAAWHKLFSGEYHRTLYLIALCEPCSACRVMLSAACAMFWMLGDSPFATRNSPLLPIVVEHRVFYSALHICPM